VYTGLPELFQTLNADVHSKKPTKQKTVTWLESWSNLSQTFCPPASVQQVQLNQPFGKDSLQYWFYAAKLYFHPVVQSKILRRHRFECDNYIDSVRNTHLLPSEVSKITKPTGKKQRPFGKTGKQ
jgi:hypothetical protein